MIRVAAALVAGVLVSAASLSQAHAADPPPTPPEHVRTPDQTFLTFPEWYLVHSPAEYAAFLARTDHPSRFPLFSHIAQFWQSYAAVAREIRRYPFNSGYHLMVMVIGTSTTVEYALKGCYERTIGRLAEATRSGGPVPEERFAADYAQSYVDFIRVDPWYRYDFAAALRRLWRDVPMVGPDLPRKWERRFVLTSELLVEAGYARLIQFGTHSIYDPPKPVTAVVLTRPPAADASHPDVRILSQRADGVTVATIPRYEGFTTYGRWLAANGIDFVAVAGNGGEILVSELVPDAQRVSLGRPVFEQPILTRPGIKRTVFALPIARLADELRRAAASNDVVEHVYDF